LFRRFKISLFQPRRIADLQNDTKLTTLIYYILLTLLATIPYIVLLFSSTGLSYDEKLSIRNEIRNQDIPYEIIDYKLVKDIDASEEDTIIDLSETMKLIITDKSADELKFNPFHVGTYIILTEDKVIYHAQVFEDIRFNYSDYEDLKDLDLSGATNNDSQFWDVVFSVVNKEIEKYAPTMRILYSIAVFFAQALFLTIFSLLVALFQRLRLQGIFSFGKVWQLTIYAMTPYIILTLIGDLYGLRFISIIGIFVSYFYANRIVNTNIRN
jgi:hypothetical protein